MFFSTPGTGPIQEYPSPQLPWAPQVPEPPEEGAAQDVILLRVVYLPKDLLALAPVSQNVTLGSLQK